MNTTQLECFMAVSNFLNFSRAAQVLRITQPAVSHQINTLEDELGVKLFQRTSKSVRLTREGYLFSHYAGEILKLSDLSKTRVRASLQEMPTRLGIGCRNMLELRILRPALEQLRRNDPQVLPLLRLIPFDSLENLLAEGDIQMMFATRSSAPKRARYRELLRCPAVCICGESHPLASRETLTAEELRHQSGRIAVGRPPICPPDLFAIQSRVVAGRAETELLFCDNQEVIYTLVQTGYAFAIMADFPTARLPGVRYIPLPEFDPLSFGAVYLPEERSPALRQMLNYLEETIRQDHPA